MRIAMLSLILLTAVGCAHKATGPLGSSGPRVLLAYEDGQAGGMVVFPNNQYESIIRFEMPAGEHRPLRLWMQVANPGAISVTLYDTNLLDAPGEPIGRIDRDVQPNEVSNGKDGLWLVQDISHFPVCKGIVWLGMKKLSGTPTVWSSRIFSSRYFLRSESTDLLPVKETPLVRLEVAP